MLGDPEALSSCRQHAVRLVRDCVEDTSSPAARAARLSSVVPTFVASSGGSHSLLAAAHISTELPQKAPCFPVA